MYEFFMLLVLANGSMNSVTEVNERRWVGGFEIDMLGKVHQFINYFYTWCIHRSRACSLQEMEI